MLGPILVASPAAASVYSVSSPTVEQGVFSLETGLAVEHDAAKRAGSQFSHAHEISYGITHWWKSGLELEGEREPRAQHQITELEWQQTFALLSQTAAQPLAVGVRVGYTWSYEEKTADEIEARLLLQHENGPWRWRLNIGAVQEVGPHIANSALAGDVRAQALYRVADDWAMAVDYLAETGPLQKLPRWAEQEHRLGPVLHYDVTEQAALEVGYLAGLTSASPNHTLTFALEYEF